ncbi:MAG: sodium:proton antiporter [Deinococcus sp.]|uniref:cation:proton antiporter n=1 Tax=Deinococcus sp. TaxID=47478 RepID=UPI0026DA8D23|nr:sodium:proton antiporter [Deinococcus sp.]MDO4246153.1 sodium:proton antiporter [Deinococcus sp.]
MSLAFPLLIMLGALAIAGIAHRRHIQPGLVIVLLASAVSFIPGLPRLQLPPEVILGLVVPPLLYSAAYNTSIGQFRRNLQPILALGVGLVVVTTLVGAYFTHWLLPSLGLSMAFVLASVVSPPDTVTTVSHGREYGLTRRVQSILIGESLVNDAIALTLFALALNAVAHQHVVSENPVLLFLYQAVVGLAVGTLLGAVSNAVRSRMQQAQLETAFGFILPFAAYLSAEVFHASGILAVVAAAFCVSLNTLYDPRVIHRYTYRTRLQESQFWPVVDTLLEAFVFAYMGLQLRFVLDDLRASGEPFGHTLLVGLAVTALIMLVRMVWALAVFHPRVLAWFGKLRVRRGQRGGVPRQPELLTGRENVLIGWTGMRGIITLAAAAGVPLTLENGEPFPGRAVIQTVAFIVTITTLLVQGATLPLLSRRLRIDTSGDAAQEKEELVQAYRTAKTAPADDFPAQRRMLGQAMLRGEVQESAARTVMLRLDLEQSAQTLSEKEARGGRVPAGTFDPPSS